MRKITVTDPRPEVQRPDGSMRHVATFNNIPADWDDKRILETYGIAEHLRVVEQGPPEVIIQRGREDRPRR